VPATLRLIFSCFLERTFVENYEASVFATDAIEAALSSACPVTVAWIFWWRIV
jgi:hypothetical protein